MPADLWKYFQCLRATCRQLVSDSPLELHHVSMGKRFRINFGTLDIEKLFDACIELVELLDFKAGIRFFGLLDLLVLGHG
jgi:hypothetical protein